MIAHTMERALKAEKLDKVFLAIDSEETLDALSDFEFDMVMTSKDHCSGTDRVAEVAKEIKEAELIINIQGDELYVNPNWIKKIYDRTDMCIAAWGNNGQLLNRSDKIRAMLPKMHCLKITKSGEPSHPLYLKASLKPITYRYTL